LARNAKKFTNRVLLTLQRRCERSPFDSAATTRPAIRFRSSKAPPAHRAQLELKLGTVERVSAVNRATTTSAKMCMAGDHRDPAKGPRTADLGTWFDPGAPTNP
jgi:hypothetical protein